MARNDDPRPAPDDPGRDRDRHRDEEMGETARGTDAAPTGPEDNDRTRRRDRG